jgi:hypothetical protein
VQQKKEISTQRGAEGTEDEILKKSLCALSGREKKSPSALRPGSGRTAKYLITEYATPFVLRFSKHERIFSHDLRLRGEPGPL